MKFGTKVIHAGIEPDPTTGAIMTPVYQTSTFAQPSPGKHKGYEYARTQNPTRDVLQNNLAALENATHGLVFASGMSAIDAVLKLLKPGDEVLTSTHLYGGTYRLFTQTYQDFGIKFKFVDMQELNRISEHFNEHTKLVWIETPSNPMMNIIDIKGLAGVCKKFNALFCVDNTFATPYLQNPVTLGADIVMHSVTKYISGHSDVIMGALMTNHHDLYEKLAFNQNSTGAVPGPQDCFLALRGVKTLHIRMQRHCENGRRIAHFLKSHPKVSKVYWPGFEEHQNHMVAKRQMSDFGGMIAFVLKDDKIEPAIQVMEKLKLFTLAESLGGVESLVGHPASMTHASIPREERIKSGLKDSLIRLSVGIEDAEDLVTDLEQALGK
ncbi:trans-sulfuration enzyme family protein [Reichenbachiella agariperforans]|uniref:trans-sulfuration enzyme family protein n=1 Tax=Reichenbachiella agariperforans TaxID=156994 RepID=UPI001C081CC8|nr:PLP-dependent aspartate aminotransferase family protein [Reichenbachiella agariperforans]MBU2915875.1 PLP-dependent aspartate aminotransferase family protein [Reichenbachiella agariperforans]